ncbi:hypothetical protein [Paenibacillus silviterrae]|uniref:hypothetical protein n=1 Tax=Paenibacillus silviterrae TaxID=3242194 RepID=UPI002543A2B6|nr:hypothetical protein [Paenibacillus chinjuensis]
MLNINEMKYSHLRNFIDSPGNPKTSLWSSLIKGLTKQEEWMMLRLELRPYDILRAEVFLDDLYECTDEEVKLDVIELVALLYAGFLKQVRLAKKSSLKNLASRLMQKYDNWLDTSEVVRTYQEQKPDHWILVEQVQENKSNVATLHIEMRRKSIVRGEVLLRDLNELVPSFALTLEQLISTLFVDFVAQVKSGKTAELIDALLHSMNEKPL